VIKVDIVVEKLMKSLMMKFFQNRLWFIPIILVFRFFDTYFINDGPLSTNIGEEIPSPICPPFVKQTYNMTSPTGQLALPIVEDCIEAASISWDFIDKIIYINARQATDRNEAMLRDFLPVFKKQKNDVIRFEALTNDDDMPKVQGTGKSHIGALQLALVKGFKNVLILEDDVLWRVSPNRSNLLLVQELVARKYDVVMLGGTAVTKTKDHQLLYAQTASSYLVDNKYIPKLIKNFEESLELLFFDKKNVPLFAFDVWWRKLMEEDNWKIVTPSLVIQTSYPLDFGYSQNGMDF